MGLLLYSTGRVIGDLVRAGEAPIVVGPWRDLRIDAPDRDGLLQAWIRLLVDLVEQDGWLAVDLSFRRVAPHHAILRARGMPVEGRSLPTISATIADRQGCLEARIELREAAQTAEGSLTTMSA